MTILRFTSEKKHSVRYDRKGENYTMSVYVPKTHPIMIAAATKLPLSIDGFWPQTIHMELTVPKEKV